MNLVVNLFFMVLLTALTGVFMQILWWFGLKICVKGNPLFVYAGLRLVCLSYLFPAAYIVILPYLKGSFYYVAGESYNLNSMLELTPHVKAVLELAALVWFLCFLTIAFRRLAQVMKEREFLADCRKEESVKILAVRDEYCKTKVPLKRKPEIYRSGGCSSPMCMGLFSKKIILPEKEYTNRELEIIFLHEMTHLQKHDLELKWLSVLITMIHCFNPMAFSLLGHLTAWSEIRCDICACRAGAGLFTVDDYFDYILDMMKEQNHSEKVSFVVTGLLEKSSQIQKRIEYTRSYGKNSGFMKAVSAVMMLVILSMGLTGACLASSKGVQLYDTYIWKHFGKEEEKNTKNEEIILSEIKEKWNFMDMTNSVKRLEKVMTLQWKTGVEEACEIKEIYRENGEFIKINVKYKEQTNGKLMAGIIEPNGIGRYIEGVGSISYAFEINQTGNYSIFFKNTDSLSKDVSFICYLLDKEDRVKK